MFRSSANLGASVLLLFGDGRKRFGSYIGKGSYFMKEEWSSAIAKNIDPFTR